MAGYWFKPKRYGWGLYPISWQGWLSTACLIGLILVSLYSNGFTTHTATLKDLLSFILDVIILSVLFIVLFREKTDGQLRWRWGGND
ncbi:hypothetical protein ACFL1E_04340 [Candidatus Omnitrophota bacterium]